MVAITLSNLCGNTNRAQNATPNRYNTLKPSILYCFRYLSSMLRDIALPVKPALVTFRGARELTYDVAEHRIRETPGQGILTHEDVGIHAKHDPSARDALGLLFNNYIIQRTKCKG